jgi:hypothetical protein
VPVGELNHHAVGGFGAALHPMSEPNLDVFESR